MNVINLEDHKLAQQERAWNDYVEKTLKAHETRKLEDGIAAGQAYGRFVRLFCSGAPQ